ncbi:MAG: LytR/AlgR family response regulator transcription factor [Flammeovirgaceae bacterium]
MKHKCLVVDDEEFSREVVKQFISRTDSLELHGECFNAEDAFVELRKGQTDIVFLDVEMPGMSGIDLVKQLEVIPQVIMITSRQEYAVDAFNHSLTDYLVKPINYPRFLKAVDKAKQNITNNKSIIDTQKNDIYVKADSKIVRLQLSNILFIEALSDYVIINTPEKKLIVHSTMKGMERKLPATDFIRVHRSYIVNVKKIDTIEDMTIIMPTKNIPIGASYKNKFMERLNFL